MSLTEAKVKDVLSSVIDPALGHDIVGFRVYQSCEIAGDDVLVKLALPTAAYPQAARRELTTRIETALKAAGARAVAVMTEVVTAYLPAPSEKALLKGPKNVIAV